MLSITEFTELYCYFECDGSGGDNGGGDNGGGDHGGDGPDQDCKEETQVWNMELCQCISLYQCENICESPLIKDPILGCECITMTEYLALYDHGYDEMCKKKDDDCCGN